MPPVPEHQTSPAEALEAAKEFAMRNWKILTAVGVVAVLATGFYVASTEKSSRPPAAAAAAAAEKRRAAKKKPGQKAPAPAPLPEVLPTVAREEVERTPPVSTTTPPTVTEQPPPTYADAVKESTESAETTESTAKVEEEKPSYPPEFFPADIEALSSQERTELAKTVKDAGNKYYAAKKFDEAIELYSQAINLHPHAVYYSNRAACYANLEQYDKVIEDCTEALKRDKHWGRALNRRAQAYEHEKRYTDALNDYTAFCVLEEFKNEPAINATDRVLKIIGKEKADEVLKNKVSRLPSETFIAAYMDSFRQTSTGAKAIAESEGDAEADLLIKKAYASIATRNWQEAYQFSKDSVENGNFSTDKWKALAYNLLGTFSFLKGDIEDAMSNLEKALEFDPKNVNSIIKKASILMERAAIQEAIEAFDEAERVDPNDPDLYYHRGQVRFLMQDNDNAIADYKKSLELDDNFVYAYIQLGVGQYKLGQTAKAMATFKKAAKKFKGSGEVYNYHGEILLDTQNWNDALENFDKAIELMPNSPLPYINKAILYLQWKQDPVTAEAECRKATEVDPQCDIAFAQLAQLLLHQNKVEESLQHYDKAAELARTEAELMNAISCREAAAAQLYVSKAYPDLMAKLAAQRL
ncbi:TOM (translocase of outer membrane) complex component [Rhizophlyctis rosea]|uniref:TOM (Translocase of outer membrane) complex component n=1 Tax=Rhizophlyctis rosea TaxID=64517 RepID=A0AAD5SIE3_9FUNG|nr:TOM (translocase of outer membrane) complex component [Rhizophlyctis rosea]